MYVNKIRDRGKSLGLARAVATPQAAVPQWVIFLAVLVPWSDSLSSHANICAGAIQ